MITTPDLTTATGAAPGPASLSFRGQADQSPASFPVTRSWPSARTVWILRGICTIAFCISGYLGYTSLSGTKVAGCGGGLLDCSHVLTSRWSGWLTIPVSFPALGLYAVCLAGLGAANTDDIRRRQLVWNLLTAAGIAAGLAAFWFICLQVLVIGHLCPWCLGAHSCGLVLAGFILWQRPAGQATTRLATLSVLGVGVLVGGQLAYEPEPVLEVIEYDSIEGGGGTVLPPDETGTTEEGGGVFAPPGADDEVFAPPGMDDDVFAPPGAEDDSGVFAPPGAETEKGETEFEPNGD